MKNHTVKCATGTSLTVNKSLAVVVKTRFQIHLKIGGPEVKMEKGTTFKDFFCELCQLQFDKKSIYDMHVSILHGGVITNKVTKDVENCDILVENGNECNDVNNLQNNISEDFIQNEDITEGD